MVKGEIEDVILPFNWPVKVNAETCEIVVSFNSIPASGKSIR